MNQNESLRDRLLKSENKRLRKSVLNDFSASLLNNTKWRELMAALEGFRTRSFRVKLIDDDTIWESKWLKRASRSYVEGGDFGPVQFVAVEWLEILTHEKDTNTGDSIASAADEICRKLKLKNIPFTKADAGTIRIVGHRRA